MSSPTDELKFETIAELNELVVHKKSTVLDIKIMVLYRCNIPLSSQLLEVVSDLADNNYFRRSIQDGETIEGCSLGDYEGHFLLLTS